MKPSPALSRPSWNRKDSRESKRTSSVSRENLRNKNSKERMPSYKRSVNSESNKKERGSMRISKLLERLKSPPRDSSKRSRA